MDRREFFLRSIRCAFFGGGTCCVAGCGTIFHSERIGQPHSRDIDWKIAALNGLGLALFFVPGVVAFAVDFHTGAIYLPYESYDAFPAPQPAGHSAPIQLGQSATAAQATHTSQAARNDAWHTEEQPRSSSQRAGAAAFHRIHIAPRELHQRSIEDAVTRHVGEVVTLSDSGVRVSSLSNLDQFTVAYQRHRGNPSFGLPPQPLFRQLAAG